MKRRYKEAFEQLNTRENLEERIISSCMNAEPENTPELRRMPKRIVPVAIAAALGVGVLGVSAYAITTNIHKQADTYFTRNDVNTELVTETETESEERIYDDYYRELGLSAVSGDTTVNLHGYVSDNQTVYLFGNIIAPPDTVLDNDIPDSAMDYDFGIPQFEYDSSKMAGPGGMMPNLTFLPFDPELPNQREFVYKLTYFNGFRWEAIKGFTITEFNVITEITYSDTEYENLFTGTWEFPELNLTTTHEPIPLINEPTVISWYHIPQDRTFEITYSEITISISGIHLTEIENKDARRVGTCSIFMKDGTVYERMDENKDNILVDLDEVDYVQIGDQTFDMPE